MKPIFASRYISFGRVKASARKIDVGMARADIGDQPFPERQRLGVRIVDAEDAHALLDPEQHHVAQREPQRRLRRVGVEIDIDDVLVFLRRILGVADRAVGPPGEPVRMLAQPGMIGRALHGEIERDLHARARRRLRPARENPRACRARGCIASWPPSRRADGIGAAGIAGSGRQRVVAALAVGLADRMDRRQIEHVEAHRARCAAAAPITSRRCRGGRDRDSGERGNSSYQLAKPACDALDQHALGKAPGEERPRIGRLHQPPRFLGHQELGAVRLGQRLEPLQGRDQGRLDRAVAAVRRVGDQRAAFLDLERDGDCRPPLSSACRARCRRKRRARLRCGRR